MKIKRNIIPAVLLITAVMFTACAKKTDKVLDNPQKYKSAQADLFSTTFEEAEAQYILPKTLDEFIESCHAVALVEVESVTPVDKNFDVVTCRVEKDYFGNINYWGMDEGYIKFYPTDDGRYKVGERRFFFMYAFGTNTFPNVKYYEADPMVRLKLNDDGTMEVFTEFLDHYGITSDLDMDAYLEDYADGHMKPSIEDPLRYYSYEEALENSTRIIKVEVTGRENFSYLVDRIYVNIIENLSSEGQTGNDSILIPEAAVCESEKEYVILLDEKDDVISPEYSIMSVEKYEELIG